MEEFRLAKKAELNKVNEICNLIKEEYKKNNIKNLWDDEYPTLETFIEDYNNQALYVYLIDDEIVGSTSIYDEFLDIKKDKTRFGFRLMVKPSLQNQGIGTKIIQATEEEMLNQGIKYFEFLVSRDNPKAVQLYLRLGCENLGHFITPWDQEGDYYYLFRKTIERK